MTVPRDPARLAQLVVVVLIAVFGISAAFTDRDPLNPYWITLITTVLGISIATSKGGDPDDDEDFRDRVGRWFRRRPEKVERQADHEPSRGDRSKRGRAGIRGFAVGATG